MKVVGPEGIAVCFSDLAHVWDLKAEWAIRVSMPAPQTNHRRGATQKRSVKHVH